MEVEALAIEAEILIAWHMKITQIIIESNALSTVISISENFAEGSLDHLQQGILNMLRSFTSQKVKHLKMDYDRATHELAQFARRGTVNSQRFGLCNGVSPPFVHNIVQVDYR